MSTETCPATITERRHRCTLSPGHDGRHSGGGWLWWHGNGEACEVDGCEACWICQRGLTTATTTEAAK